MIVTFPQIRLVQPRVVLAMRLAGIAIITSLMAVQMASAAQRDSQEPGERTVNYLVMAERAQPFQIAEDGVSSGGIITDIVLAIFSDSPWTVKPIVMPIKRLQQSVLNGDVNDWITYDSLRWHSFGNEGLLVDESLFDAQHTLLTCRKDLPDHIKSIDQLQGLKLATIRDFDYPEVEKAARKGLLHQITVDRFEAGINLAKMGRVDGFVEMTSRLRYHMKTETNSGCLHWVDMSDVIPDFPIYLSVSVEWPRSFRSFIAGRIQQMKATGELDAIRARYGPVSPDHLTGVER